MNRHESAVAIQRVVRGFLGRLEALRRVNAVYEKVYDPKTGAHYYYNTKTFETAWHVRYILRGFLTRALVQICIVLDYTCCM